MTKTTRKRATPATQQEVAPTSKPAGKLEIMASLLRREEGATIAQLSEATGWQAHSLRGAMAGSLKKKHGLTVTSDKVEDVRVYRAAGTAA